ncbi:unnamed protein product [Thlaspi arvense]|uniref:Uncharacterized protein n=1 Tax=Thlaspi arvense TaxID=13288 RepID=A0AAU9SDL7_THLAR|nr:unnamed protein product [Thlaspi arvense]
MSPEKTQETTDCLPEGQSITEVTQPDDPVTMASTNEQEENESIRDTSVIVPEILTASDCQERVQSPEAQISDIMMPQASEEDVPSMFPEAASIELPLNVTMASTNEQEENESIRDTSVTVPEVLTASGCQERVQSPEARVSDILMPQATYEGVSTELPLNREENSRTSHDAVTILDQEMPRQLAYFSVDPSSTLEIEDSEAATSDQGIIAQVTCSHPSSPASLVSVVDHSEDVQEDVVHPPNNPTGQNPLKHLFIDPFDYEIEKLRIEEENVNKNFEEKTSELMSELERKMAEIQSEYDKASQELDAKYNAEAMENEAYKSIVEMSSLLANAFVSKCAEVSPPKCSDREALREIISEYHSLQQEEAQRISRLNSTAPPRPSATAAEARVPNPSAPLSNPPRCTTAQPRPVSQQVAVQATTHLSSTAPPRASVSASEARVPNPSAPLSNLPGCTTAQPRPVSQQGAVQATTHLSSTAPPRASTTASEARVPNPSAPLSNSPRCTTAQPRPVSQQVEVQATTHLTSTAPPRASATAAEARVPNPSAPLLNLPRCATAQPRPVSQQLAVQATTHLSSTAPSRPSVTPEALSLHSSRRVQPRPPPPVISNLTPSTAASSPLLHGTVRAPAPHMKPFRASRDPISADASTKKPKLVEEQQQQQGNSDGGLVYLSDDE